MKRPDNDELLADMRGTIEGLREDLDAFQFNQGDDADEGNEDKLLRAWAALDMLDGALEDLVP